MSNVSRQSIIAGITAAVAGVIAAVSFKASAAGVIGRKVTLVNKHGSRRVAHVEGGNQHFLKVRTTDGVLCSVDTGAYNRAQRGDVVLSGGKDVAALMALARDGWWRLAPEDHDILTVTA